MIKTKYMQQIKKREDVKNTPSRKLRNREVGEPRIKYGIKGRIE